MLKTDVEFMLFLLLVRMYVLERFQITLESNHAMLFGFGFSSHLPIRNSE